MEAAAVVCRGGLLAQAWLRGRAPARRHGRLGSGIAAPAPARPTLLVAPLGEPLSPHSLADGAVAQEVDEDVAPTEILTPPDVLGKTVHVKFVLQKQCAVGQQFLVVGDDPALGLWDPTKATALDWSEDHVWTVKKDLPANKSIEFKFLLQDPSGQFRWQDGPNRTLQTTETTNTLVVYEDWDDAKNQKVSVEGELSIGVEDVIFSDDPAGSDGAMLPDELPAMLADELQMTGNPETNKGVSVTTVSVDGEESAAVADASLHREIMGDNESNQPQKFPDELREKANMVPQNGNSAVIAADDYAGRNEEDSIFGNDLVWVRSALQQLLRNLGFQIGTTKT